MGQWLAAARPSMVVIWALVTELTGTTQLRTALPSTVQAPHAAMPQPNLVPVSWSSSRRTQRSGASGSMSRSWGTPLTVRRMDTGWPPGSRYVEDYNNVTNNVVGAGADSRQSTADGRRGR